MEYELSFAVACKQDEILSLVLFGSCPKLVELSSRIENITLFFRPMPLVTFDLIFHFFVLFVVLFQPHWPACYSCFLFLPKTSPVPGPLLALSHFPRRPS